MSKGAISCQTGIFFGSAVVWKMVQTREAAESSKWRAGLWGIKQLAAKFNMVCSPGSIRTKPPVKAMCDAAGHHLELGGIVHVAVGYRHHLEAKMSQDSSAHYVAGYPFRAGMVEVAVVFDGQFFFRPKQIASQRTPSGCLAGVLGQRNRIIHFRWRVSAAT